MVTLELRLLGEPRLILDSREEVIEPRIAFEVLALVACEGEPGISRVEVAKRFWSHLDDKNARQQLRIALYRLRAQAKKLGFSNVCNFDEQSLKLRECVQTDIGRIGRKKTWTLAELEPFILPFAQGWKEAHWTTQRDVVGELIADAFDSALKARTRRDQAITLLRSAVQIYPTTTKLTSLLVEQLLAAGAEVEANEVVIRFEDHWVERFGAGDIPQVMSQARDGTFRTTGKPRSRLVIAGLFLALASVVGCSLLLASSLSKRGRLADLIPNLRPNSSRSINSGGHTFSISTLQDRDKKMCAMSMLTDGAFVLTLDSEKPSERVVLQSGGGVKPLDEQQAELVDRDVKASILRNKSNHNVFTFEADGRKLDIGGTADLPRTIPERFVNSEAFLFDRVCSHKEADHRHLFMFHQGHEKQLDEGLGDPQVSVLTAIQGNTIYGKLSNGKSDGWNYQAFSYDLATGVPRLLKCPPVGAVSSEGDLATLPEVVDVKEGDYSARWGNQVLLVPKSGKPRLASFNRQTRFLQVDQIGDALILKADDHFDKPQYIAIDFRGKVLEELTAYLTQAVDVWSFRDAKRGLVQLYNNQAGRFSYAWIEATS